MPADDSAVVFVYGTLMRGESRHHALAGQTFHGDAITQPHYRLFLVDDFPGLVEVNDHSGCQVAGQLWGVDQDTLARLDEIECVSEGLYRRRSIRLANSSVDAMAWFYLPSAVGLIDCGHDWRLRPGKSLR